MKMLGLLAGLAIILLFSCERRIDTPVTAKARQALQEIIDRGELLNTVTENAGGYTFVFESETVHVPLEEIKAVKSDSLQWKTMVAFADATNMVIPFRGTSLDFIVNSITINPSGYNPLAAVAELTLPTFGRVRVTVHGKKGSAGTISHLCQSQTVKQSVPVLGLYHDHDNLVEFTFTNKDGHERGSTLVHIKTESLGIADFPRVKIVRSKPELMEPGVNLVSYPGRSEIDLSIPYMVDHDGEVRWVLNWSSDPELKRLSASIGLHRTNKGTFITGDQVAHRIVEVDMFGNLLKQWDLQKLGYAFHHEVAEAANGNFLLTVTRLAAKLMNGEPRVNDFIIELDPSGGSIVREWDLASIIDTSRYAKPDGITPPQFSQNPTNWAHNNAINEFGNDLLATMRYQGVMSFSRGGRLLWLISPHKHWSEKYRPYLLNPVSEDGSVITDSAVIMGDASAEGFDWPWGPHTPVVLPNNHILVFDNGYNRNWVSNMLPGVFNYSRAVEYKVDVAKKTVQQVWSYGKERGAAGFSQALSGVQYLPNTGHILFCAGMGIRTSIGTGGRVVEVEPVTKDVVFEMELCPYTGSAFHRVTRMQLYPGNL